MITISTSAGLMDHAAIVEFGTPIRRCMDNVRRGLLLMCHHKWKDVV